LSVLSGNIPLVESAFYEQVGQCDYLSMPATMGPWSADAQHGGPPSALAARAIELHQADPRQRLARVCVDILRPIPIGKVSLKTRTVRPGRRVALVEAVMEADGQEVLHASGWRIERQPDDVPEVRDGVLAEPVLSAGDGRPPEIFASQNRGYLSMIEWRFKAVEFGDQPSPGTELAGPAARPGPTGLEAQLRAAWARPRIPLLAGEEPSPMTRTLLVADSGSGVGAALPSEGFIFINVDLTVVLQRDPVGDWLLLEASTVIGAEGTGLATTRLADQRGSFGRAMQTLLVAPLAHR
jgi:Thioesterase-like superfamily